MSTTFRFQEETIEFLPGETVLDSLIRNDVAVEYGCKNGSCQSCLLRSNTQPPPKAQVGLSAPFKEAGCFLACQCPAGSVEEVQPVGEDVIPILSTKVILREMISKDVLKLRLVVEGQFQFSPGMFVRLITPDGVKRSYSIANNSLDQANYLEFHVRLIPGGAMSEYLSQPDCPSLQLQGPFGKCTYGCPDQDQRLVFIGSGTGLAPLFGILTEGLSQSHQGKIDLFFGGTSHDSLYFLDELDTLTQQFPNVTVRLCSDQIDPLNRTRTGSPLDAALDEIRSFTGCRIYTCGHPELVKATKKKVFLAGANMGEIYSDSFDRQS